MTGDQLGAQKLRTLYTQQLEVYASQGVTNKDPRHDFTTDLQHLILEKLYIEEHNLVIGVDANESASESRSHSVFDMFNTLCLHDALIHSSLSLQGRQTPIYSTGFSSSQ